MGISMFGVVIMAVGYGVLAGYYLSLPINLILCGMAGYFILWNGRNLQARANSLGRSQTRAYYYENDFEYRNLRKGVVLFEVFLACIVLVSIGARSPLISWYESVRGPFMSLLFR